MSPWASELARERVLATQCHIWAYGARKGKNFTNPALYRRGEKSFRNLPQLARHILAYVGRERNEYQNLSSMWAGQEKKSQQARHIWACVGGKIR